MAIPYAPRGVYQPDNTLIGLIQQAGRDAAQGQRAGGAIWGNTVNGLGQIAAGTIADIAAGKAHAAELRRKEEIEGPKRQDEATLRRLNIDKVKAEVDELAKEAARGKWVEENFAAGRMPTPTEIIGVMGDKRGLDLVKTLPLLSPDSASKYKDQATLAKDAFTFISALPEQARPSAWSALQSNLKAQGAISDEVVPPEYSPEALARVAGFGQQPEKPANMQLVETGAGFQPFDPRAGKLGAVIAPPKPKESTVSFTPKPVMVGGKEVQANYNDKTGKYYDVDTGAELKGVGLPPTADMRNKTEGRKLVKSSIDSIKAIGDKIITSVGPAQRAEAIKRGAEAVFGTDPTFRTYQDARVALAGNLAVAQQGSRPSDADVKSVWLPLVPDPYRDTSESAAMKWELISRMSNVEGSAKEEGGWTTVNGIKIREKK